MILKNAKIYSGGLIHKGVIHINTGIIKKVIFEPKDLEFKKLIKKNPCLKRKKSKKKS